MWESARARSKLILKGVMIRETCVMLWYYTIDAIEYLFSFVSPSPCFMFVTFVRRPERLCGRRSLRWRLNWRTRMQSCKSRFDAQDFGYTPVTFWSCFGEKTWKNMEDWMNVRESSLQFITSFKNLWGKRHACLIFVATYCRVFSFESRQEPLLNVTFVDVELILRPKPDWSKNCPRWTCFSKTPKRYIR